MNNETYMELKKLKEKHENILKDTGKLQLRIGINKDWESKWYANKDWNDEDVVSDIFSDERVKTCEEFFDDDYYETYSTEYTTPNGEVVVAFGYYGYN